MSMDGMSGSHAFEHVVDKLVEEGRRNASDTEKRLDAERRREIAERALEVVRSELIATKKSLAEYVAGDDAYGGLYDAVEMAAKTLSATDKGMADILLERLAKAKKFIDPIPF